MPFARLFRSSVLQVKELEYIEAARAVGASDWRINEFVRIENLFDKNYVGSVIIGDTNRRFFEPAPRRNAIVGINAVSRF